MGADVVGTPSNGRCPITAIAIGKGIEWDPWVRGPGMVIREAIAAAIKAGTRQVAEIWGRISRQILDAVNPWATVKGPHGSPIYTSLGDWLEYGIHPGTNEATLHLLTHRRAVDSRTW